VNRFLRQIFFFSASFLIFIFLIVSLSGCDISSIENALGLGMHSNNTDDNELVAVEIEYYDKAEYSQSSHDYDKSTDSEVCALTKSDNSLSQTSPPDDIYSEYDDINKHYALQQSSDDKITLSFAGDICLTEGCSVLNYIKNHDNDMSNSFDDTLLTRMVDSDIFMLNNEFPYSDGGTPLEGKMYTFRASPSSASYLHDIGTDIVSLANNHCYDYGPEALMDTFTTLKAINLPYVGAGENITEAMKPAYFDINGKTIAIIAATQIEGYDNPETKEATDTSPGVLRCLDTTRIKQVKIKNLSKTAG